MMLYFKILFAMKIHLKILYFTFIFHFIFEYTYIICCKEIINVAASIIGALFLTKSTDKYIVEFKRHRETLPVKETLCQL